MESQIESSRSDQEEPSKRRFTPEMAEAHRKKESLLLARAHLLQQISVSQNPRHRTMLESALAEVERQLAGMGAQAAPDSH